MFGFHINKDKTTISKSIEYHHKKTKFECAAIFISNPRAHSKISEDDELKSTIEKLNLTIIAHGSYCDVPWKNEKNMSFVLAELNMCHSYGIKGMVIHLSKSSIEEIKPALVNLLSKTKCKLYLETPAINKSDYATPEQLLTLIKELDLYKDKLGICIDTAHIHISGVDLSSYKKAKAYFDKIEEIIKIYPDMFMLHLNDSTQELGKGRDQHEALMKGKIWKGFKFEESGLCAIFEFIKRNNIITILERKEGLIDDFKLINRYYI